MRLAAAGAVLLAGCYNPTIAPGAPCQSSRECPGGQQCVASVCGGTDDLADAGPDGPVDAAFDAPPPDAIVYIDYVIGTAASELRDVSIAGYDPNFNFGALNHMSVDDGETGLVMFDLTSILTTRTIVSATLRLQVADQADESGGTVTLHRLREAWVESEASWIARATGANWSLSGARPPSRDAGAIVTFSPSAVNTDHDLALPASLVQDWVTNPASNFGVALVRGTSTEHVHIVSREAAAGWARLTIRAY
jgi:hypothetical protein